MILSHMDVARRMHRANAHHRSYKVACKPRPSAPTVLKALPHSAASATAVVTSHEAPAQAVQRAVQELDPTSFYDFISGCSELCVVDYYTDWCGPCQLMHKEVDKLTSAFKNVKFAKLNCGTCEEFSSRQRIRALPTFRLYYKGTCVDEITGAKPVQLRQLLTHYLFMLSASA